MGAAAYNRGTQVIRDQIDRDMPSHDELFISDLNALPKKANAPKPFGPIQFENFRGGWWATCPVSGYGFYFKSLREAVQSFRVYISGYSDGKFIAQPIA